MIFSDRLGNEEAQSSAVGDIRFASSQGQQDLPAAVCDETLHAVQIPVSVFILVRSQTHRLQVAAGIRFGQDHGAGYFAFGKTRQHLILDLLAGKRVNGLGNALQSKHIHERRVGAR